jgi:formylglycine-generating enzyme required for sulfatase activity
MGVSVSEPVERVFQRALAVRPEDRYSRAREFWKDLEAAQAGSFSDTVLHPGMVTGELPAVSAGRTQQTPLGVAARGPESTTSSPSTVTTGGAPSKSTSAIIGVVAALAVFGAGTFFMMGKRADSGEQAKPEGAKPSSAVAAPLPSASVAPAPTCPADMVLIPAGQFFMGSDAKDALPNQKPSHQVTLNGFCMDLYEVSARKYKECSTVGKCKRGTPEVEWPKITPADKATYSPLCTLGDPAKGDHPANCLGWEQASTYCKNNDKRLPTEAEWEYATRGPDGRVYPWGDEAPTAQHLNACGTECLAWAKEKKVSAQFPGALYQADDGFPTTAPVGKFPAGRSRFGPYDVVGNVWEWVADWEGTYEPVDQKNPTGPDTGTKRVIRGGAWNGSFPDWLHPSFRYAQVPEAQSHGIGFRCAKTL